MTTASTSFDTFLENVRLTKELRDECEQRHKELRARLLGDRDLSPIYVSMFLQVVMHGTRVPSLTGRTCTSMSTLWWSPTSTPLPTAPGRRRSSSNDFDRSLTESIQSSGNPTTDR